MILWTLCFDLSMKFFLTLMSETCSWISFFFLFLCRHFILGQIINLWFLLCLLQMPEIGSLLLVFLLSDICSCESLSNFKVSLKTFLFHSYVSSDVQCYLYMHLFCRAFSYIMWWDFCKSNNTGWVLLMKVFSSERTWETRLWVVYGKKRHTFIIFTK